MSVIISFKPQCVNFLPVSCMLTSGIILRMRPANERWRYSVTPSLIGWAHTQNDLWDSLLTFRSDSDLDWGSLPYKTWNSHDLYSCLHIQSLTYSTTHNVCLALNCAMSGTILIKHYSQIYHPGLILGLRPANERRRYKVTPSLIGWAQTWNQSWSPVVLQVHGIGCNLSLLMTEETYEFDEWTYLIITFFLLHLTLLHVKLIWWDSTTELQSFHCSPATCATLPMLVCSS